MVSQSFPRLSVLLLFAAGFLATPSTAQMMASERSQVHHAITGTNIVIDYSRPSVRGRSPIWGGVEPWGTVWTPGANTSTSFKFSKDVKLNGTDIEAGKYSVWFELLEDEPWNLVLYTDTTMFHIPYPSKDSAMVVIPIHPEEAPSFVETLRFDIENVRIDGADIQFRWANTLVPIRLDVDPGYDMVYTAEEAAPYVGDWNLDSSMSAPSDSLLAIWRADTPEERLEEFDNWTKLDHMLQDLNLRLDEESGHLIGYNRSIDELIKGSPYAHFVLIRKGEGVFVEAGMMAGEIMYVNEYSIWEFEFDDSGRAVAFVQRARDDDHVLGQAERPN